MFIGPWDIDAERTGNSLLVRLDMALEATVGALSRRAATLNGRCRRIWVAVVDLLLKSLLLLARVPTFLVAVEAGLLGLEAVGCVNKLILFC